MRGFVYGVDPNVFDEIPREPSSTDTIEKIATVASLSKEEIELFRK
jgi:hypothetical protein